MTCLVASGVHLVEAFRGDLPVKAVGFLTFVLCETRSTCRPKHVAKLTETLPYDGQEEICRRPGWRPYAALREENDSKNEMNWSECRA